MIAGMELFIKKKDVIYFWFQIVYFSVSIIFVLRQDNYYAGDEHVSILTSIKTAW